MRHSSVPMLIGLLALASLAPSPSAGAHEVDPSRMDLRVFVVLKVQVEQVIVALRAPVRPQSHGTGVGGPDEERARSRITALAPVLSSLSHPIGERIETIRTIAVQGQTGPLAREAAVHAIGQCLQNPSHDARVQRAALEAFAQIGYGSRRAIAVIGAMLETLANPVEARLEATRVLCEITCPETTMDALRALSGVAHNPSHDARVQHAAVEAIARVGRDSPEAADLLGRFLDDLSHPIEVRLRVIGAMLHLRDAHAREVGVRGLARVLDNPSHDERVQRAAVEALAFIGRFSHLALDAYGRVLRTTSNPIPVRLAILEVLQATPDVNAREAVLSIASVFTNASHDERVQRAAARAATAMGRFAPAEAVAAMALALRHTSFTVATRIDAIEGVARIGRGLREAEVALEGVIANRSHDARVHRAAQEALRVLYSP